MEQILRSIQRTLFHAAAHKMKRVPPGRGGKPFLALWLGTARHVPLRCACLIAQTMQLVNWCIPLNENVVLRAMGGTEVGEGRDQRDRVRNLTLYVNVSSVMALVMGGKKLGMVKCQN
uniref:Uncharacterized protein n=1 Tax=Globodera rostochiensis TaxID=31243 RepID=A0A914ICK6_GLORO